MGPPVGGSPGQTPDPRSRIETIDLHNSGTVRILPGASLLVHARITDYDGGGAALVGGSWELLGTAMEFSNLDAPVSPEEMASMGIHIVEIKQGQNVLTETFDLEQLNTDLFYNLAEVTLSGAALFPNFNTIGCNIGGLHLRAGQQFQTAGDLANWGTITLDTAAGLHVAGSLRVPLGQVDLTDGRLTFADTLEVIGGRVTLARGATVSGLASGPEGPTLLAGWTWKVHEATETDPQTGQTLQITPGVLDLQGVTVAVNQAEVLLEGAGASFQALSGLRRNSGSLLLDNAARLTIQAPELLNTGTIALDAGALLIVEGNMRNQGRLSVGTDSMLGVTETLTLDSALDIVLDGVIQAAQIEILQSTEAIGSGRIVADLVCGGTLGPGSSPGQMEIFGDVELGDGSVLRIELPSRPGDPHDKLLVHGRIAAAGTTLRLVFDPDLPLLAGGRWVIVDAEQFDSALLSSIEVEGLTGYLPGGQSGCELLDPDGTLLGTCGSLQVLLYTEAGGAAGQTVEIGVVPEPATILLLLTGLGSVCLRRRGRP